MRRTTTQALFTGAAATLVLTACGAAKPAPVYDVSVGATSTSDLGLGDAASNLPTSMQNIDPGRDSSGIARRLADELTASSSGPQAVEGQATCSPTTSLLYSCDLGDGSILTVRLSPESNTQ